MELPFISELIEKTHCTICKDEKASFATHNPTEPHFCEGNVLVHPNLAVRMCEECFDKWYNEEIKYTTCNLCCCEKCEKDKIHDECDSEIQPCYEYRQLYYCEDCFLNMRRDDLRDD